MHENVSVFSPHSGKIVTRDRTMKSFLNQAIVDILGRSIRYATIKESIMSEFQGSELDVAAVACANLVNSLKRGIKMTSVVTFDEIKTDQDSYPPYHASLDPIAIVGMSGRFPGGENLEEFWKVIEQGLDLHQKVFTPLSLWVPLPKIAAGTS